MIPQTEVYKKQNGYIRNSILILIAFATAFFPRILHTSGAPAIINFFHFAVVPLVFGIVITTTRVKDKNQISASKAILVGLLILLIVMTASALLNQAGLINVFLAFMLLAEPFLVIVAIMCLPFSPENFKRFRAWMLGFVCLHIFLAMSQHFLMGYLYKGFMTMEDNVQGVFYLSGAGHVVGASVSMSFGLYYFVSAKTSPIWLRCSMFCAAFLQLLFADAKQVLLVFLIAWLILIFIKVTDIKATIQYLIAAILVGYALVWATQNLEQFSAFAVWIRPDIYAPDGAATVLKLGAFRIIPSYYKSPLNWLLGLGPGHTVGRLGGWMLKDYVSLLKPLGATIHPASEAVWATWRGSWLDSSLFSPLFGWVGIWGDTGFLGLAAYLYLAYILWRRICLDDFSKFMMLTVMIFGFIFTQMEEPGYMISIAILIGMRWQERHISMRSHHRSSYLVTDADPRIEMSR